MDKIKDAVPRYSTSHWQRIVHVLNKLERGDHPTLRIDRKQDDEIITAVVFQYAKERDEATAYHEQI